VSCPGDIAFIEREIDHAAMGGKNLEGQPAAAPRNARDPSFKRA
jgi:hypothetical protein